MLDNRPITVKLHAQAIESVLLTMAVRSVLATYRLYPSVLEIKVCTEY